MSVLATLYKAGREQEKTTHRRERAGQMTGPFRFLLRRIGRLPLNSCKRLHPSATKMGRNCEEAAMSLDQLIFVGFNSRVAALDRDTGQLLWQWKARKGSGYVTVLLDGDRLIVSVIGYTYCLDPLSGQEYWFNELSGMGSGVACLASVRGGVAPGFTEMAAQDDTRKRSDASGPVP
jgi:hypothetical protein